MAALSRWSRGVRTAISTEAGVAASTSRPKAREEGRARIRVGRSGRVSPAIHLPGAEDFGPGDRRRQETGVAEGDVGPRNLGVLLVVVGEGKGPVGQARAAEIPQVPQIDLPPTLEAVVIGDLHEGPALPVLRSLPVAGVQHRHLAAAALQERFGEGDATVETPAEEGDGGGHDGSRKGDRRPGNIRLTPPGGVHRFSRHGLQAVRPGPQPLRRPRHPADQGLPGKRGKALAGAHASDRRPARGSRAAPLRVLLRRGARHSHGLLGHRQTPRQAPQPRQRDHPQPPGQRGPRGSGGSASSTTGAGSGAWTSGRSPPTTWS